MPEKVINAKATCANIRRMFEEKGYKPEDIRKKLHLGTVQSVYKWYSTANGKGNSLPSMDNFIIMAQLLGVTIDELIVTKNIEFEERERYN